MFADPIEIEIGAGLAATDAPPAGSARAPTTLSHDDAARFRALVDGQFDFIWRFLRGLGVSEAGIDDAAQHVFMVTAQRIAHITLGSERSFLLSTARGVAANARRAQARRREVSDDDALDVHADPSENPEERASKMEARARLDEFLEELPEEMRAVFVLFELEGVTMAAIAQLLAIPPGTVASRLRRAREAFHEAAVLFGERVGGAP